MSQPRQSHQSKSIDERAQYWQNVIRVPGPTAEDSEPIIDTTDSPATTEAGAIPTFRSTKPPSAVKRLFQEKLFELIIGSIIVPLSLWVAYQLYTLNREVGELWASFNNVSQLQASVEAQVEKTEKRLADRVETLSSDVDRMERRIDGLVDRQFRNETHEDTKK